MTEIIKIDKYQTEIIDGEISYFAIAGKKKYSMPKYFKDMYNNKYLAITNTRMIMPELFDTDEEYYIPLFTGDKIA